MMKKLIPLGLYFLLATNIYSQTVSNNEELLFDNLQSIVKKEKKPDMNFLESIVNKIGKLSKYRCGQINCIDLAVETGNLGIVKLLVEKGGATPVGTASCGSIPLVQAAYLKGYSDIVDYLLSQGAHPDDILDTNNGKQIKLTNKDVEKLITKKVSLDAMVVTAINNKDLPLIKYLVEYKNAPVQGDGYTAYSAYEYGSSEIAKYLINKGAKIGFDYYWRGLIIERNDLNMLDFLISKKVDVNSSLWPKEIQEYLKSKM